MCSGHSCAAEILISVSSAPSWLLVRQSCIVPNLLVISKRRTRAEACMFAALMSHGHDSCKGASHPVSHLHFREQTVHKHLILSRPAWQFSVIYFKSNFWNRSQRNTYISFPKELIPGLLWLALYFFVIVLNSLSTGMPLTNCSSAWDARNHRKSRLRNHREISSVSGQNYRVDKFAIEDTFLWHKQSQPSCSLSFKHLGHRGFSRSRLDASV